MTQMRLDRLLSNLGYCSRKEAALVVKAERIALSGKIIRKADESVTLAQVASGALTIDSEKFDPPPPLTIMFNKPAGYSCSHDEKGRLIYDLLPERWKMRKPSLSCVGRLDKDSTGQLLLTDDGDLLHRIIHPKSHAEKYYSVTLAHDLRRDEAALFSTGEFLMKDDPKPLKAATWIQETARSGRMILTEGRYRQIRRMFETLGNQVLTLHRTQTGGLVLENIEPGHYKILGEAEIASIFVK